MSPESLAVLSNAIDAIKIVAPAITTGLVGYFAAKIQMNFKLKELDKSHEFEARAHLFNYYKDRMREMHKNHEKLSKSLGELAGQAIGYAVATGESEESTCRFLTQYIEIIRTQSGTLNKDILMTKKELGKNGFGDTDEYRELDSYIERVNNLERGDDLSILHRNLQTLHETYAHLFYCEQLILEKHGDKIFNKYLG